MAYGQGVQEPVWDRLPATGLPMLLVGEHDATFRPAMQRMVGMLPNGHLDRDNHAAHREAPRQVTTLMEQFLE